MTTPRKSVIILLTWSYHLVSMLLVMRNSGDLLVIVIILDCVYLNQIRIGFWFYELCAELSNGLPYLLKLSMHNSTQNKVTVDSIAAEWISIIKQIGSDTVPKGIYQNPKCYLAFDSYYMSQNTVTVVEEKNIPLTCSVNPARFQKEINMINSLGNTNKVGETMGIYNEEKNQLFVFHHDSTSGVGKKYNFSQGFICSTDKYKIKDNQNQIPGYSNYKTFFKSCDNFNLNLNKRHWPHTRGGKSKSGEVGEHHDFVMACVLQNTFNAYHYINNTCHNSVSFPSMCDELSHDIFLHSINFENM